MLRAVDQDRFQAGDFLGRAIESLAKRIVFGFRAALDALEKMISRRFECIHSGSVLLYQTIYLVGSGHRKETFGLAAL